MGIQIKNRDECLYFVNVYLPYQCPDNYELYVQYLGKLLAIIEDYESSKVAILLVILMRLLALLLKVNCWKFAPITN